MDSALKAQSTLDEVQHKTLEIIDALTVLENKLSPVTSPVTSPAPRESVAGGSLNDAPSGSHLFTVNANLNRIRDQIAYIQNSLVI